MIIVGLVIGVLIGIAPVFLSGIQEWTWHTTVLVLGSALVIGHILYSWIKEKIVYETNYVTVFVN